MARVLVVEDEPNIAGIIVYKLRREGHTVEHVAGVGAARAVSGAWDVVLLDSSLPGEDAFGLLVELAAAGPVAVMTESRDEETPRLVTAMGAAAVVRKPFKPTVLARLVLELDSLAKGDSSHSAGTAHDRLITPMATPEVVG